MLLHAVRRFRPPFWLYAVGITVGVIAYSLVLGRYIADETDLLSLLLLLLPGGALAFMFASHHFRFGVLLLPIAALAVPFSITTGTESKVPISLALVLLLTLIWMASMNLRGWRLAPSPLNQPLLVFGTICILSLIWGIIWRDPILIRWPNFIITQLGSLLSFLLSVGAALLIGNFVTTRGQLKYIVGIFLVCLSLMTLTRLYDLPFSFLNSGGLWGTWLVTIAYGLMLVQPGLRWYWRVGLLLLLGVTLNLIVLQESLWLSGWVPAIVTIFAITLLHSRKAFFILLIVGALFYQTEPARTYLADVKQSNEEEGSASRLELWETNWRLIREHWLLGTGPAGYAIYYMTYNRADARSTHNNYFDIAAQFGVIGFVVWIWLSVVAIREGWRLVQRAPPGFLRTLAVIATAGWMSALVAMFFGDWVLPFAYNVTISGYSFTVYSWIFLGTLISIRQLLAAQADAGKQLEAEI